MKKYNTEYKDYSDCVVISVSTDRNIFDENSSVRKRMEDQSGLYKELHIIVFSKKKFGKKIENIKITENCTVYPTNSLVRWNYVVSAINIGEKIIKKMVDDTKLIVTAQDPFETGLAGKCLVDLWKNSVFMIQVHTDLYSPYFASIYVGLKNAFLNRIRLFIARFTLPQADIVRVVSVKIADSLVARGFKNEEIIVKPIFVNVEKIKNTIPSFDLRQKYSQFQKIVLMVSRLEPEKNIDMAIQAMKIVDNMMKTKKQDVNVGLVVVGSGGELENLKNLVKKLNIETNVIFDGWQNDTVPYYKGADVYLMTSWYEGYGMTLIEANAVGCRIVSTDVGVAREIGASIVGWSPEDVAEELNKILS